MNATGWSRPTYNVVVSLIKIDCKHRLNLAPFTRGEVREHPKCKQHFQESTLGSGKGVSHIARDQPITS